MPDDPVVEVKSDVDAVPEIKPDAAGKYPETVPWKDYVGVKESLGNKLDKATQKVTELEEQAKKAVSTEEHDRIKTELETAKTQLQDKTTELNTKVEATLSEKRAALVKRGVSEEKAKELSEKEIDAVLTVEIPKPKPDLGGGGGGEAPAKGIDKVRRGFDSLHPSS